MKNRVALFDGDLITYRAAAAVETRSVSILHKKSQKTKVFKTRTEFKNYLSNKKIEYKPDDYLIADQQEAEPEAHAFQVVKQQIQRIAEDIEAEHSEVFVGGKDNFRLTLDLPVQYKSNRGELARPLLLDATKQYSLKKYPGGLIEGVEVDDHVVIRSHELLASGFDPVVISLDKDCKGCVGIKYYNWTDDSPEIIEIPAFGYLEYDSVKKKMLGSGLNFYCYQLLKGDSADCYSPGDLHKKRFGDVSVYNLLKDCKTVDELFKVTEQQFKLWFPDPVTYMTWDNREVTKNYKEIIELYHTCVYMRRIEDDDTTFYSLWEEFK